MREAGQATDERYLVPGLTRGLALLEAFTPERPELTLIELSRAIGLSRSSVFRLAYTLCELGFLVRDANAKTYRLGARVLKLGFSYLSSQEILEVARPHLETLRDRTDCSAHMAVLEGAEILYVARVPDRRSLTGRVQIGTRFPAYATTMGRMMLAQLPPEEVRKRFAAVEFKAFTPSTPTSVEALLRLLEQDRLRGYIVSRAGFEAGIAAVAAPVFGPDGAVAGAINIITAESTVGPELETRIKDAVVETARTISEWLGHPAERRRA